MLHLINYPFKGPLETGRCLARLNDGDHLLFLGNGVLSVVKASVSAIGIESELHRIRVHALLPDLAARGISAEALLPEVGTVDYSGFVGLAAEYGPVQSWFR